LKATVEELKSWQKVLNVEITDEEFKQEFQQKLDKYQKDIKLPGFRQGRVPAKMIESRFGPTIRVETVDELINKTYREACKQNNIVPLTEAKISDLKVEEQKPISFKAEIEVDPAIEIKGYKKLKIKPDPKKIKDSDVENAIEELRERMAELKAVQRVSQKGDMISIEYLSVTVDGKPVDDLKSPQYPIEIGKGTLKDFDKGLAGLSAAEEAELSVKFPKDYHIKNMAGKTAELKIKVTSVQEKILPEVNEEFCKKVGAFQNREALTEGVRKDLEAQEKDRARNEAHAKAIDVLIKDNDFEVPPSRVEFYIDKVIEDQARYYPPNKAPAREEVAKQFTESGIRAIKRFRIVEYIASAEKVKAGQEEVDKRIQSLADYYGKPFEEMKDALRKNGTTMRIREEIREQKTLDSLIGEIPWEKE